jgi:peptide chain release factor 2
LFELESNENESNFAEVETEIKLLSEKIDDVQIDTLLNGKYDNRNSIWTLRSGEGGTEAADWTKMLFRMYERYLSKSGYKITILDTSLEGHGGIKSRVFKVSGPFSYGKFKNEAGTHRLVRISPFDSNKRRHTSFAGVEIIPEIDPTDSIEIPDNELKIDIFRSSGPGGQSVNTTDSAVRITHLPTNTVVSMQNERSQIQNKANAMNILKSKLLKIQTIKEKKEKKDLAGDIKASWGDQVRNYILNPFQLVKDIRTKVETSNASAVLDGNLDEFIKAEIRIAK